MFFKLPKTAYMRSNFETAARGVQPVVSRPIGVRTIRTMVRRLWGVAVVNSEADLWGLQVRNRLGKL